MKVPVIDVRYSAELSRLEISEEEMPMFTEQFNQILEYADILEKVDTAGIEPTFSILPLYNVMREDEVVPGVSHDEAMKNAPAVHNDGFKVPRVIG